MPFRFYSSCFRIVERGLPFFIAIGGFLKMPVSWIPVPATGSLGLRTSSLQYSTDPVVWPRACTWTIHWVHEYFVKGVRGCRKWHPPATRKRHPRRLHLMLCCNSAPRTPSLCLTLTLQQVSLATPHVRSDGAAVSQPCKQQTLQSSTSSHQTRPAGKWLNIYI